MSGENVSYILFDRASYRELLHDLSIKSPRNVVRDLRGGINGSNPTACTCSSCGNYAPHKEHESPANSREKKVKRRIFDRNKHRSNFIWHKIATLLALLTGRQFTRLCGSLLTCKGPLQNTLSIPWIHYLVWLRPASHCKQLRRPVDGCPLW